MAHHENPESLGRVLQAMQRELNINSAKLCEKAEVDESYYSRLVRGKKKRPGREKLLALGFGLIALDIKPNGKERKPIMEPADRMNRLLQAEDMGPFTGDSADVCARAVLSCLERKQYTLAAVITRVKTLPPQDRTFAKTLERLRNAIGVSQPQLYRAAHITPQEYQRIITRVSGFNNPHICKKAEVFLLGFGLISLDKREMTSAEQKAHAQTCMNELLRSAGYCALDTPQVPLNEHIAGCIDRGIFTIAEVNGYLAEQGVEPLFAFPDAPEECLERGEQYAHEGDYAQALRDFTQAIRLNPDFTEAYLFRGMVYRLKGGHEAKSIQDFTAAIRLKPDFAEAYNWRGILYLKTGDYDRAIADLKEAFMRYSTCFETHRNHGEAARGKAGLAGKIKELREIAGAKEIALKMGDVLYQRGLGYAKKGDLLQGFLDFAHAMRLNPEYCKLFGGIDGAYPGIGPGSASTEEFERNINAYIRDL